MGRTAGFVARKTETVPQIFEEELLIEKEHLAQGCADPRVIEFPRDARARKWFRCAAALRVSCGSSLALATRREESCRLLDGLSCSVAHNCQHIDQRRKK